MSGPDIKVHEVAWTSSGNFCVRLAGGRAAVGNSYDRGVSLDQRAAGEIAKILQRFADTGKLAEETMCPVCSGRGGVFTTGSQVDTCPECHGSGKAQAEQSEVSDTDKVEFITARGWTCASEGIWGKGGAFLDLDVAYQHARQAEQPEAVAPGYPYVELPSGERYPYAEQPNSEQPQTNLEDAVTDFLQCQKSVEGAKSQLLEQQKALGAASDNLMRYRPRIGNREVIVPAHGSFYILRFYGGDIVCVPAMTARTVELEGEPF